MIVARRWIHQSPPASPIPAAAVCSQCDREAEVIEASTPDAAGLRHFWRCPRCGATARLCPLVGGKGCVLPHGHGDRCQSRSGSSWYGTTRQDAERQRGGGPERRRA